MNPLTILKTKSYSTIARTHYLSVSTIKQAGMGQMNTPSKQIFEAFADGLTPEEIEYQLNDFLEGLFSKSRIVGDEIVPPKQISSSFEDFEYTWGYYQSVERYYLSKVFPDRYVGTRSGLIIYLCMKYGIPRTKYALASTLVVHYRSLVDWEKNKEPARTTVVDKALRDAGITFEEV